jgi:hypothetical protein
VTDPIDLADPIDLIDPTDLINLDLIGGAGRNCTAVRKNVPTGVYVRSTICCLVPAVEDSAKPAGTSSRKSRSHRPEQPVATSPLNGVSSRAAGVPGETSQPS